MWIYIEEAGTRPACTEDEVVDMILIKVDCNPSMF